MNAIFNWVFGHTRTVIALALVMVAAGFLCYQALPRESDPDIDIPVLYVVASYPGVSPSDGERLIARPMETALRTMEGLQEMTSTAFEGGVSVLLEFDVSFDQEKALTDLRERVDSVRPNLPADMEEPTVHEVNTALLPVIVVTVAGDAPERTLYRRARELETALEALPGVLQVNIKGLREEAVEVVVDPTRLETYGLRFDELLRAVDANNRVVAAGVLEGTYGRFPVEVPGLIENARELYGVPVRADDEGTVTVGDIAEVRRTFKAPSSLVRFNGTPALALEVTKRLGTNIVDINSRVRDTVAEVSKEWDSSIKVDFLLDNSTWVEQTLSSLTSSIIVAIFLVMVVVVGALGLRSGMMVGLSIPVSFLIGFIFISIMELTLNIMVMFGMLLSVGILVDSAIVVVEFADRRMHEQGMTAKQAYIEAARRMFWPVFSSTATTLAVFVPMLLWPGVVGKFMSFLPLTLITVLGAALITSMILLPVIGGWLSSRKNLLPANPDGMGKITQTYTAFLSRCMRMPLRAIGALFAGVVFIFVIFGQFNHGIEFFVATEPSQGFVNVRGQGNISPTLAAELARKAEDAVLQTEGVRGVLLQTGSGGNDQQGGAQPSDLIATVLFEFDDFHKRRPGLVLMEEIRERASSIDGVLVEVREQEGGPQSGKDMEIEIRGTNYPAMNELATTLLTQMENDPTLTDVDSTAPPPSIQWSLSIDREKASRLGADINQLGAAVLLTTTGARVGSFRPDDSDTEVDILARYPADARGAGALDRLRVNTANGVVPASVFMTRKAEANEGRIERVDGLRRVTVRANTIVDPETGDKILATSAISRYREMLEANPPPPNLSWRFRGSNEDQGESANFLFAAMAGGLFLMFLILLTQYNSVYQVVVTLITVILSSAGVLLGMLITGQTFSIIMTGTGMVALAGIVVNNAIVLIDSYNRALATGIDPPTAALQVAAKRLRPVLLTTITTICGLMPMALQLDVNFGAHTISQGGPVSSWWVQLASAIIWGLGFSTVLTLVLIPLMLALPHLLRNKSQAHNNGSQEVHA